MTLRVGAVVIGRNLGSRLDACLRSTVRQVHLTVYVDSGSRDGSAELARGLGVPVVVLYAGSPSTVARARNAGIDWLTAREQPPDVVQFVDGDCVLAEGWVGHAADYLADHPGVAVACGHLREAGRASPYQRLLDMEFDRAPGETRRCGGIAMMRLDRVVAAGGFDDTMEAGEDGDLCDRLLNQGHRIWRLDRFMATHDSGITTFRGWWRRALRTGRHHAQQMARPAERRQITRRDFLSPWFWAFALPLLVLGFLPATSGWSALLLLLYPLQLLRIAIRRWRSHRSPPADCLLWGT